MLTLRGRTAVLVALVLGLSLLAGVSTDDQPPPAAASDPTEPPVDVRPAASPFRDGIPGRRHNVVVIMADDMRADELQFMPHTRRLLGDQGVRFTNSFSPHPLCCPARASFITGQYTHNHGVWSNRRPFGFEGFDDTRTLATHLREAGYQTGFVGKYLNGYGAVPAPDGSADDSLTYVPPGWTDWRGAVDGPSGWDAPEAGGTYRYFNTTLSVNGVLRSNRGRYQTTMIGDETGDLLTGMAASPRPFFLWASYVAPHNGTPAEPDDPEPVVRADGSETTLSTPARPRHVRGMYDSLVLGDPTTGETPGARGKPFFIRDLPEVGPEELEAVTTVARQRAESLHVLDEQVRRTVDRLDELGILENTHVVFVSDNGFFLGEHRMLRGKNLPYDVSLRVPTLMRGPGLPAGTVSDRPLLTIDLAPTFLGLAGARPAPEMDGVDVLPVSADGWSRGVLTETGPRAQSLNRRRDDLLDLPAGPSPLRFTQGVRTARYLYVEHASRERELYDVLADPLEQTNLVDDPALQPIVRRLAVHLDELRTCSGASCATPLPEDLRAP